MDEFPHSAACSIVQYPGLTFLARFLEKFGRQVTKIQENFQNNQLIINDLCYLRTRQTPSTICIAIHIEFCFPTNIQVSPPSSTEKSHNLRNINPKISVSLISNLKVTASREKKRTKINQYNETHWVPPPTRLFDQDY